MSLPTLVKTWQVSKNQTVAAQGTAGSTRQRLLRTIKNLLTGFGTNPWAVRSSNDGAGGFGNNDSVDRWAADANLVGAAPGSNHSWIVLRQTGIATNFELCFDLATSTTSSMTIIVSPSAGFGVAGGGANGTATARPTATDEIVLINNSTWWDDNNAQHQIHAWQSTDGAATRVIIWRAGTNLCTFWLFEKPRNPRASWSNPSVSIALAQTTTIANSITNLYVAPSSGVVRGRTGATTMTMTLTGEASSAGLLASTGTFGTSDQANDIDAAWDFYPIGLLSGTTAAKGRHGMLNDVWWAPASVTDADTAPNNASDRQFVKMGGLWLPWDPGGSTVPLLT